MKKIILIAVIVLLLGVISYYLYTNQPQKTNPVAQQQTSVSPTSTTTSAVDKTAVFDTADSFYKSYDSCMKNPPAGAAGNVGIYCQNNTGFSTSAFLANLDKGGTAKAGADPILCAQNPPESITVEPNTQITVDKAVAYVVEKMGPTQIKIQADLLKENGVWKIDNITCPAP